MLSDRELERVQCLASELPTEVTIFLHQPGTITAFESDLANIGRQVSGVSLDRIRLDHEHEPVMAGKPSLTLSREGSTRNIHYMAAPQGAELSPFLEGVSWLAGAKVCPVSRSMQDLGSIQDPMRIMVFIVASCPHCPEAVRAAISLAACCPKITVLVIDALEFPDLADRYKVKSTPTIIVDEGLTLVGTVTVEELASRLAKSYRVDSLTAIIRSMIDAGRAEDAGRLIVQKNRPDAVLPIYRSPEFSLRMGALVAMEEAVQEARSVFDPVLEELTSLLMSEDPGLRGDTAEFLGKTGNHLALPALERLEREDPNPDVRDAAQEAIQLLYETTNPAS